MLLGPDDPDRDFLVPHLGAGHRVPLRLGYRHDRIVPLRLYQRNIDLFYL
jgi:hypothetical protein